MDLVAEVIRLSGSGKRVVGTRKHGLYSSMTLPMFAHLPAVRDTHIRFKQFKIRSLKGKSVCDIGCNVGAMAFEALQRGATELVGYEFNQERVDLCDAIAKYHKLNAEFYQVDLNTNFPLAGIYDIVFCFSVDEYIDNVQEFYNNLRTITVETLYFESNVQQDQDKEDTIHMMEKAGFRHIYYKGYGHSGGISRKRHTYICE